MSTLQGIQDEDKQALATLAAKYPDLDMAIVPRTEFEAERQRREKAQKDYDAWDKWAYGTKDPATGARVGGEWDDTHKMTKTQLKAEQNLVAERGRLAELQAGYIPGGDEVNFDEIRAKLDGLGYVKADTLTGFAKKDELKTTLDSGLNNLAANQEFLYTRSNHYSAEYRDEFKGERFPMDKFLSHVTANGVRYFRKADGTLVDNFDDAYNDFVQGKRQELKMKELDQRAAEIKRQEEELAARKIAPNPTDSNINDGGIIPPFQAQIEGLNKEPRLAEGIPLGSGVLGAQIAEKYMAGGYKKSAVN